MYRKWKVERLALVGLAVALVACGESTVAPRQGRARTVAIPEGSQVPLWGQDTVRFNFVIDPHATKRVWLGQGNSIIIPGGVLCDTSSTYGPATWDTPCSPATYPLQMSGKAWLDSLGHPRVDFSPNVRFVPSDDPASWVELSFTDGSASVDLWANIWYCPTLASQCVDESLTDPSLLTVHDPLTGQVTRRVKHFSGYDVAAGSDSSNTNGLGGGMMNRVANPLQKKN